MQHSIRSSVAKSCKSEGVTMRCIPWLQYRIGGCCGSVYVPELQPAQKVLKNTCDFLWKDPQPPVRWTGRTTSLPKEVVRARQLKAFGLYSSSGFLIGGLLTAVAAGLQLPQPPVWVLVTASMAGGAAALFIISNTFSGAQLRWQSGLLSLQPASTDLGPRVPSSAIQVRHCC